MAALPAAGAQSQDGGTEQWRFETEGNVRPAPTAAGGTVYAGNNGGNLYALDAGASGSSEGSRVALNTVGHHDRETDNDDATANTGDTTPADAKSTPTDTEATAADAESMPTEEGGSSGDREAAADGDDLSDKSSLTPPSIPLPRRRSPRLPPAFPSRRQTQHADLYTNQYAFSVDLRRAAVSQRDDVIVQFGAYVGLRAFEVLQVQPQHVDTTDSGTYRLRVPRGKDTTGGGKPRDAHLPALVERGLQRFQNSQNIPPREQFVDLTERGVRAAVKRTAEAAAGE